MAKVVVGSSPTTGEVLVHNTDTGSYSWQPGTDSQIAAVSSAVWADETGVTPYSAPAYDAPTVVPTPPPPPPPEKIITYVVSPRPDELAAAAKAETTGGYVGTGALTWIIQRFNWLSDYLYKGYLEILALPWPFWQAAWPFYLASQAASQLAWGFYEFASWVYDVGEKVSSILTWDNIWSYLLAYIPNLEEIGDWFYNWWSNVTAVVTSWWSSTRWTVQGWISAATQGLDSLKVSWSNFWNTTWPALASRFNSLLSSWDNFRTVTFPTLVSFTALTSWWGSRAGEVQGLIDSSIKRWFPFYNDLARLWSGIKEFFTDPEAWLYKSLDRIVERFW